MSLKTLGKVIGAGFTLYALNEFIVKPTRRQLRKRRY